MNSMTTVIDLVCLCGGVHHRVSGARALNLNGSRVRGFGASLVRHAQRTCVGISIFMGLLSRCWYQVAGTTSCLITLNPI